MIYLASPYSHSDAAVREARFDAACRATGVLMSSGLVVYSPIAHSHSVAARCALPTDWRFWRDIDLAILARCDALYVLKLPGWEDSIGVKAEIEYAESLGMEVHYIDAGIIEKAEKMQGKPISKLEAVAKIELNAPAHFDSDQLADLLEKRLRGVTELAARSGAIHTPDGSWWKPERVVQMPGAAPWVDGWIKIDEAVAELEIEEAENHRQREKRLRKALEFYAAGSPTSLAHDILADIYGAEAVAELEETAQMTQHRSREEDT